MSNCVFVIPSNSRGGAERILICLSNELHELGMKGKIIFLSENKGQGYPTCLPVLVFRGSFIWNLLIKLPFELIKLSKEDIVISSQFYINVWIAILKMIGLIKARSVARESTRIFQRFYGWKRLMAKLAVRMFYLEHNVVVAQTPEMLNDLLFISPKLNGVHLNNPVILRPSLEVLSTISTSWFDRPTIVAAGRLIPIKNHDVLLKAFSKMSSNINLIILGEGPERKRLEIIAEDLNVADRLFLPGEVADPLPFFSNASVCVVSSSLEGFPNVLLEMMSVNGAVVSTDCADGIRLLPGIVVCEPNNLVALKDALEQALRLETVERLKRHAEMKMYLSDRTFKKYWEGIQNAIYV